MNERIQELVEEAKLYKPDSLPSDWYADDYIVSAEEMKKFAELIIKECASHLNWVGDDAAGIELLEHFGVEQ